METPLLLIIFNRPETTKKVFEAIRLIKPKKLYIAADGPRENKDGEKELCEEARKIATSVDWPCETQTLFREKNLGCRLAVSSAIDWFFENVEQGIIPEDDCLPNKSFFNFCEEMLEMYKDDARIMHISGDNFQFGKSRGNGDYYFSKIVHIWGWATWRRAWKYYDLEMKSLEDFTKGKYINDIFNDKISEDWINTFIKTKNKEIDTWDHQWTYAIWSQNGLAILPNKNLVENIGFGVNATHTKNTNPLIESNKAAPLSVVSHPNIIARDYDADLFFYKKINPNHNIVARIINKIKNYAKKYQNNL